MRPSDCNLGIVYASLNLYHCFVEGEPGDIYGWLSGSASMSFGSGGSSASTSYGAGKWSFSVRVTLPFIIFSSSEPEAHR